MRDFKRLQKDPPAGISGTPTEANIMFWHAVIFGPEDTPWEGGTFKLSLTFSEDYPNKAPVVKFESKMFHPNIYADGGICLDILQNQWSPIYDVSAVLTSIQVRGFSKHHPPRLRMTIPVLKKGRLLQGLFRWITYSYRSLIPITTD